MDINISFLTSNNYRKLPKKTLAKGERSAEGGIWCTMAMPVIGLFLEMFAGDKWTGAALWLTITVLIWIGCFADYRQINSGLDIDDAEKLRKYRLLPPVYLFKRGKMLTGEGYKGIVLGVLMAAAVFGNGFTQGLMINEDTIPQKLENTSVMSLDNFRGKSSSTIGERFEAWFDDGKYDAECTRKGGRFTVRFSGMNEGKPAEVTLALVHDGYAFQSFKAADVTIDGVTLSGDERTEAMKKVFVGKEKPQKNAGETTTDIEDNTSERSA